MTEKRKITLNEMELVQLKAVREYGYVIKYIDNPSERVQLTAVKQDGRAIQFINNPSLKVQLEAVKQNGYAIYFIKNQLLEVQLEAVRQNGCYIQFIKNPPLEVQLEAVRKDGCSIQFMKNPSDYIKSIVDVIETSHRTVYVLHEPDKKPLFTIGCQRNITKEYFVKRIYNMDGGLEENPYRQEYLDIIERY